MKFLCVLLFMGVFAVKAQEHDEALLSQEFPEEFPVAMIDEEEVSERSELAVAEEELSNALLTAAAACALKALTEYAIRRPEKTSPSQKKTSPSQKKTWTPLGGRRELDEDELAEDSEAELAEDGLAEDSEDELSEVEHPMMPEGEVADGLACSLATKAAQLAWEHRHKIIRGVKKVARAVGKVAKKTWKSVRRFRKELREESGDEDEVSDKFKEMQQSWKKILSHPRRFSVLTRRREKITWNSWRRRRGCPSCYPTCKIDCDSPVKVLKKFTGVF